GKGRVRRLRKICPGGSRLVTMVLSTSSPSSDSNPVLGEKVALIAMVVVLLNVWPQRRCALAVNRVSCKQSRTGWRTYSRGCSTDRGNDRTALQKCFSFR